MKEKPGDPDCDHEWKYDNKVIQTAPPTYHKICKKCGRVEHERGKSRSRGKSFDDYHEEFHGSGEST